MVALFARMQIFAKRRAELRAFLFFCLYLTSMLVGAATVLYPTLPTSSFRCP